MEKPIKAVLKLPKQKTRKVWAGMYGGHYDVIVFFHKKPKASENERSFNDDEIVYDLLDNQDCIAGAMWLPDFHDLTGLTNLKPESIDVVKLHRMELTAIWDGKKLANYEMFADGWGER